MGPDLLESLKILTHLVVKTVGEDLVEFSVLDVLLSVEEPIGNLVLARVVHDRYNTLNLRERGEEGERGRRREGERGGERGRGREGKRWNPGLIGRSLMKQW